MRVILYSLLATVVGAAMVGGGIWGVVDGAGGKKKSSFAGGKAIVPANSSPSDCAQVAKRDGRFGVPHVLLFGPYGNGTVQCMGSTVNFTIRLEGLKSGTFYDVVLERGRRRKEIGSFLATSADTVATATAGPEVPLRRYDFLTVRESDFGKGPGASTQPSIDDFRAAL